jgi:hypothetical protein
MLQRDATLGMLAAPGDLPREAGKRSKYMQHGEGKQVTGWDSKEVAGFD